MIKKVLLVLGVAGMLFGTALAQEATPAPDTGAGLSFPVPELDGCESIGDCLTYCEDPVNNASCVAYAEEKGFYQEDPVAYADDEFWAGAQAELGCGSRELCETLCSDAANFGACHTFATSRGVSGGYVVDPEQEAILAAATTALGCGTYEECLDFCSRADGAPVCDDFAGQVGMRGGQVVIGPGGCTSAETCQAFCSDPGNFGECSAFVPPGVAFAGPGGCTDPNTCRSYCEANSLECRSYSPGSNGVYVPVTCGAGSFLGPGGVCTPEELTQVAGDCATSGGFWNGGNCEEEPPPGIAVIAGHAGFVPRPDMGGCATPGACHDYCSANAGQCGGFDPSSPRPEDTYHPYVYFTPGEPVTFAPHEEYGGCDSPGACYDYCSANAGSCGGFDPGSPRPVNVYAPGTYYTPPDNFAYFSPPFYDYYVTPIYFTPTDGDNYFTPSYYTPGQYFSPSYYTPNDQFYFSPNYYTPGNYYPTPSGDYPSPEYFSPAYYTPPFLTGYSSPTYYTPPEYFTPSYYTPFNNNYFSPSYFTPAEYFTPDYHTPPGTLTGIQYTTPTYYSPPEWATGYTTPEYFTPTYYSPGGYYTPDYFTPFDGGSYFTPFYYSPGGGYTTPEYYTPSPGSTYTSPEYFTPEYYSPYYDTPDYYTPSDPNYFSPSYYTPYGTPQGGDGYYTPDYFTPSNNDGGYSYPTPGAYYEYPTPGDSYYYYPSPDVDYYYPTPGTEEYYTPGSYYYPTPGYSYPSPDGAYTYPAPDDGYSSPEYSYYTPPDYPDYGTPVNYNTPTDGYPTPSYGTPADKYGTPDSYATPDTYGTPDTYDSPYDSPYDYPTPSYDTPAYGTPATYATPGSVAGSQDDFGFWSRLKYVFGF